MSVNVCKIFLATGISWIAESISWILFYFNNEENQELVLDISFPLDVINSLSGVTLFLAIALDHKARTTKLDGPHSEGTYQI